MDVRGSAPLRHLARTGADAWAGRWTAPSTCTSYDQINQESVSGIKTFRSISGCAITITGGTETGHASGTYSHWNGYKVDVRPTTCVSNHITCGC